LEVEVMSLRLVDERFYHLDTCLCPLEGGWLLYYPDAFDAASNRLIEKRVAKRIAVSEAEALQFVAMQPMSAGGFSCIKPAQLLEPGCAKQGSASSKRL
jgi:N-dimethylarginine dimethylaminohydrolase